MCSCNIRMNQRLALEVDLVIARFVFWKQFTIDDFIIKYDRRLNHIALFADFPNIKRNMDRINVV